MTTTLRQLYQNQLQKEPTINYNFKSVSPAAAFADRGNQLGLTFNYYGCRFQKSDGTPIDIDPGSVTLADNATNYVFFNAVTNSVEVSTTYPVNGNFPIAKAITASGSISQDIEDLRIFAQYAVGTRSDLLPSGNYASATTAGLIKIGSGLAIDANGVVTTTYSLPIASSTVLGGVKVGSGLSVDGNGTLTNTITNNNQLTNGAGYAVAANLATVATSGSYTDLTNKPVQYSLPIASSTVLGGIKVGSGLAIDTDGVLSATGGTGGGSAITVQDEGTTLTTGATTFNFVGAGVTASNSGTVVTVTVPGASGGSTLSYKNYTDRLINFWRPTDNSTSYTSTGSWGVTSVSGSYAVGGAASYTKYGAWMYWNTATMTTASSANSNQYVYLNNGNVFKRCGGLRCIIHMAFGVNIQNATPTTGSTNTILFCGPTDGQGSPGTPLGNTTNDYSNLTTNSISVGWRSTDSNLCIFYKNTSSALTVINLGSGFPVPNELAATPNKAAYEVIFDDMASTTDVKITVNRIDTATSVVNTIQPYPFTFGTSTYRPMFQFKNTDAVIRTIAIGPIFCYQEIP
jgi:hypothetical protein